MTVKSAKAVSRFRIMEETGIKTYEPGDTLTRPRTIEVAIAQGWAAATGDEKAKAAPRNKAKPRPKNKSA